MKIGVLALQGAFAEHIKKLKQLGIETIEIRQKRDLNSDIDGLIIPGGESTVIGKLLKDLELLELIRKRIEEGMPAFGTCAGLILLADKMENPVEGQISIGTMNITAKRNAYGRQLGSFSIENNFADKGKIQMTFIRAPFITEVGNAVEILAEHKGEIIAARQNNQLVTAFHPELTDDNSVYEYFIEKIMLKTI